MKTANGVLVALVLLAFVATLGMGLTPLWTGAPSPPGQFPLHRRRFEWPVRDRVAPFRPSATMGSDSV